MIFVKIRDGRSLLESILGDFSVVWRKDGPPRGPYLESILGMFSMDSSKDTAAREDQNLTKNKED